MVGLYKTVSGGALLKTAMLEVLGGGSSPYTINMKADPDLYPSFRSVGLTLNAVMHKWVYVCKFYYTGLSGSDPQVFFQLIPLISLFY